MAERLAKRPKISREDDDYLSGNIIEIELRNFMTFNHLKCKPGSCLNLVIGPNGSGKSSIVCAIALGLGGEPQLLGRASSIGAFVKRGESSGHIMISLKGTSNEGKITITRKIDTANKSEWMFNGKLVPKKEVTEHTQRFNIQVNNLTQFLPQDRVCEFAKLTPIQLLEETEKAVGDPRLPVQHRALVDKRKEMKRLETTVEKIGETLNQLKAVNAEQEKDVERVRQREDLLGKANSMKKKLPWLKYDLKKSEYVGAKDQENDAKMKLNEAARILNEAKEPIEKKKNVKAALDTECKNLHRLLDDNDKKRKELLENAVHLGVQVQGKYTEMEELRRQDESHQQRILKAKKDLAVAEQELANQPPYEPPRDKIERLASQILELGFSAKEKRIQKSERESLLAQKKGTLRQCQDKLGDMENTNHKLLQALHGSGADRIFEAYSWLEAHRHELNKEVYGPVLLEVNVSNRVHAEYIEGQIPYYIWKSFITQDPRDRDFLVRNLKSFDVPILNYVEDTSRYKEAIQITEEMRALGIYSRLDQVFDAPNAVKEVLISQFGLENSYIGSKETDHRADEVSRLRIMDLWTPDNHYRWSTSRYGGHVSAIVESVGRSRLLLCSVDGGEIERLRCRKRELEENISDLDGSFKELVNELKALENEAAILEKDREEILSTVQLEKKKRRELENLVVQRKRKLESFEKEGDLNVTISRLVDQVSNMNNRRFQCMIGIKNMLLKAVSARQGFAEKHMASIEQDAKIKELEANLKQQEKFALQASMHYEYCKKAVEDLRHQLLAAKKYAESVAMITPELEREFLEMPTTVEELEAAIQDNISQANSILFLNQNVLEEYELRMRKMQDYSSKLKTAEEERRRESAEIDSLKDSWLPTLRSLVCQINETFSRNFQEMAVAGEVSLDERGMDFDQYGILIKVKFRQTGLLQVLSSHHQSGGERSVSTILYLVSLQGLANCPFRVVDEINQGMDPINERKMFQQLVRAASQPNTPQSFLLTPKLLPDLEYSEACTILNIMNGPWIEPASKAWRSGECWGAVMGLVAGNS